MSLIRTQQRVFDHSPSGDLRVEAEKLAVTLNLRIPSGQGPLLTRENATQWCLARRGSSGGLVRHRCRGLCHPGAEAGSDSGTQVPRHTVTAFSPRPLSSSKSCWMSTVSELIRAASCNVHAIGERAGDPPNVSTGT